VINSTTNDTSGTKQEKERNKTSYCDQTQKSVKKNQYVVAEPKLNSLKPQKKIGFNHEINWACKGGQPNTAVDWIGRQA